MTTALTAGEVRVVPLMDPETARVMGKRDNPREDRTLAEVDGPWGHLRLSMDGFPVSVRAQVGGHLVAALTAVSETRHEEGPVPTFTDRDVPVVLGSVTGGVRFVAEGSRLRPAGRRRFLRVSTSGTTWTYGSTETQTAGGRRLGAVLGAVGAPTELRRAPDPATGAPVVSFTHNRPSDEKDPSGRNYVTLSWTDGATVGEVVLTLLLLLGTNDVRLMPLWFRAVDVGGSL